MFDPVWAGCNSDGLEVAFNDYSLDSLCAVWWLAFGWFHVESEDGVKLFEGLESGIGKMVWFNGSIVVDVV